MIKTEGALKKNDELVYKEKRFPGTQEYCRGKCFLGPIPCHLLKYLEDPSGKDLTPHGIGPKFH